MNLLLISLRKKKLWQELLPLHIHTYLPCTIFSAFPLISTCQPSTPPSAANPSTWALNSIHLFSHMECLISFDYFFPQGLDNCPLSSPYFYYHTRRSFLPRWKKISKVSFDLIFHTSYGKILYSPPGAHLLVELSILVSNLSFSPEPSAMKLLLLPFHQLLSCLSAELSKVDHSLLLGILFVSITIFSFIPSSQTTLA